MKKFLFIVTAVTLAAIGVVKAGSMFPVPAGTSAQPAPIAYGGTKYSTTSFSVQYVTAAVDQCVFQGVLFSSGNAGAYDFVDVWDATSVVTTVGAPQFRLYNINGSTSSAASNIGATSGSNGPLYPIHFYRGLMWRPNSANYNAISIQYWDDN